MATKSSVPAKITVDGDLIKMEILKEKFEGASDQTEIAKYYNTTILDLYKKNPDKSYRILIDLTNLKGQKVEVPFKTYSLYEEITEHEQTKKVAVIGRSKIESAIVELLFSKLTGGKNNWFTDSKKALRWLGIKA